MKEVLNGWEKESKKEVLWKVQEEGQALLQLSPQRQHQGLQAG